MKKGNVGNDTSLPIVSEGLIFSIASLGKNQSYRMDGLLNDCPLHFETGSMFATVLGFQLVYDKSRRLRVRYLLLPHPIHCHRR